MEDQRPKRLLVQDSTRQHDVELKHERVREFLKKTDRDALLLQDPANVAWFTAGADLYRCASEDCSTSVFITPEARLFATNSVDSAQIFEREAFGLGFQLKQREWFQPHRDLVSDLCRGRNVLSDLGAPDTQSARRAIRTLRLPLTELEVDRLRILSNAAVHAVEATGHNLRAGTTEAEVAGEVSHRLIKRTIAASRIHVCADGRNQRYRHWTYGDNPIEQFAIISCVARRWGLHVGVTRTVCLRTVPDRLIQAYQKALLVHATGLFFSRAGQRIGDIWNKAQRIYEKFDVPSEWRLADQASVIGYSASESSVTPNSDYTLSAPVPIFWHPSVNMAMLGDTLLCHESANEMLTASESWPRVDVKVKGHSIACPGMLLITQQQLDKKENGQTTNSAHSEISVPQHPADDNSEPLDSIWELKVPTDSAIWGSRGATWS